MPEVNASNRVTTSLPRGRPIESASRGAVVGLCVLLVIAVAVVFGRTLQYDFVNFDDDKYFSANPRVQAGLTWNGIAWACRTTHAANWHPLTWLSLMSDAELFGPGPMGPHLTNLLLHAASTVLLFLVLNNLTGALWRSALVAALFGVHPLHVESVAWVSERKDVLSGFLFLLTLLAYTRYAEESAVPSSKSRICYGLTLLLFLFGLMSKPMLVTLPFVLLLLDYWPMRRFNRSTWPRLLLEKLLFLLLSIAACVTTSVAQLRAIRPMLELPVTLRIENALVSYGAYLAQTAWPRNLAVFYPYCFDLPAWQIVGAGAWLSLLSLLAFWVRRRMPYVLAGWLWFLGMLVPVIGLVPAGGQAHADRYTYLPLIGVFIILVWGFSELSKNWRYRRQVMGVGMYVVMAGLMVSASVQTSCWRGSKSLWEHALACTSENYVAHNNLGVVFAERGQLAAAEEHYQTALQIKPGYADAHNNLGILLAGHGHNDEALQHYRVALEIEPDFVEARYNLGNLLARQGRATDAIEQYRKALAVEPDNARVLYSLANLLVAQGQPDAAIENYERTLEQMPDLTRARYQLGVLLQSRGKFAEAMAQFHKILELDPWHTAAQNNLAWLFATCPDASLRNGTKALALAQQAERVSGGRTPEILDTLATAYAETGQFDKAVETAKRALHLPATQNNKTLDEAIQSRLKLYEAGRPFRDAGPTSPPVSAGRP